MLAAEVNFSNFGTDVLDGGDGFDRIVFETGNVISVNGTPSQFIREGANHGVLVNLINEFAPGQVNDFDVSQIDENGDLGVVISNPRGQILDFTSVGGGTMGANGVLDIIDDPSAVFGDIEEFDLTNHDDYFLDSAAAHIIDGGGGDDFISGGLGFDVIDGGSGSDTAVYRNSKAGVLISLLDLGSGGGGSGGEAEGDKLFSIENVNGSDFDDSVIGDGKANALRGFGGRDGLIGGTNADRLFGGDGNDTLQGGADADTIAGGNDDDALLGGSSNDLLDGGLGFDGADFGSWNSTSSLGIVRGTITLATGTTEGSAVLTRTILGVPPTVTEIERDVLLSVENIIGSDFGENIIGNGAANKIEGRGGTDVINGGTSADTPRRVDRRRGGRPATRGDYDALFSVYVARLTRPTITSRMTAPTILRTRVFRVNERSGVERPSTQSGASWA